MATKEIVGTQMQSKLECDLKAYQEHDQKAMFYEKPELAGHGSTCLYILVPKKDHKFKVELLNKNPSQ